MTSRAKPLIPKLPSVPRPPRLPQIHVYAQGPRVLDLGRHPQQVGGPGTPPPNFVTGGTSASEWFVYWALARYFDNPHDPRKPPFLGGLPDWVYQSNEQGGSAVGGVKLDFLVYAGEFKVGMRLQTLRYHEQASAAKQAYDALQLIDLMDRFQIVDIYEEDVIEDPSGQAAILVVKQALSGNRHLNPVTAGTVRSRLS